MYDNLSVSQLEKLIRQNKKESENLHEALFWARNKEHEAKYETVRVKGCVGCELELYPWNNTCDHCDGSHLEERLREKE